MILFFSTIQSALNDEPNGVTKGAPVDAPKGVPNVISNGLPNGVQNGVPKGDLNGSQISSEKRPK